MTTILCFDAHREDGLVWSVRQGNKWLNFEKVIVTVPMATVYKGKTAKQPKAYLQTVEPVIIHESDGKAWIVAA